MGCQILVELAHLDASAMIGLGFLGPTMDQYARSRLSHVLRLFGDQFCEPPSLIPLQAFDYLGNGPIRTIKTFVKAVRHDMLGRITRVKAPCLILRGERDPIVSQKWAEALASKLPDSDLRIVPRAGHALNYNAARVIVPEMLAFWRSRGLPI